MNPLCLLTKGRTFKDMTDRTGYKVLEESTLSRYSKQNPSPTRRWHTNQPPAGQQSLFEEPVKAAETEITASNKEAALPIQESPVAPEPESVQESAPAAASSFVAKSAAVAPMTAKSAGPVRTATGFCRRLWHQFIYGRKSSPFRGPTVQTELALDKVTVMRNNLSEDDLEVVLVQRKVGTGEKPLARVSKMEMTGEAWLRLTAPFRKKNSDSANSPKAEKKASPELSARAG